MLTSLTTDRSALVALYNATSGENWGSQYARYPIRMSENWLNFSMSVCEWNGVTCENGRVHSLQLPALENCASCSGAFPSEIGLLDQLTRHPPCFSTALNGLLPMFRCTPLNPVAFSASTSASPSAAAAACASAAFIFRREKNLAP